MSSTPCSTAGRPTSLSRGGPARFRALAVAAAYSTEAVRAADPTGQIASYEADRLITRCVTEARPVRIAHVGRTICRTSPRDPQGAALLGKAGLHSYLAVPLIARGEVLGALSLYRVRNPEPFDEDDAVLAVELAARAAVCIDNARSYQSERRTALTLQRHLMNHRPPQPTAWRSPTATSPPRRPARSAATGSTPFRWPATRPRWWSAT